MKPMTRVYPKLRLQKALGDPRGITLETATTRGDAQMSEHKDASYDLIDATLLELRDLCATSERRIDAHAVFSLAESIVDLAGLFAPSMCRAAQSLCTLAEAAQTSGGVERASTLVHVEAMQLLRAMGGVESPQTDQILKGLSAVAAKAKA